jgi:rod shape-determining protein MreC
MNSNIFFALKLIFISAIIAIFNSLGVFNPFVEPFLAPTGNFFGKHSVIMQEYGRRLFSNLILLPEVSQEIFSLNQEVNFLQSKLSLLQESEFENTVLREELGFLKSLQKDRSILMAEVVGEFRYPGGTHYFLIDKGAVAGVEEGQHVAVKNYLLGTVTQVFPTSAKVSFILDSGFMSACLDQDAIKVRAEGICRVIFGGSLSMAEFSTGKEISVGDKIITSGKDNKYSHGYLLGTIVQINGEANDIEREAVLDPFYKRVPRIVFIEL